MDDDILALARREARVLVTFYGDFGRMIFHELKPPPPGLVFMQSRPEHARLVSKTFVSLFRDGKLDVMGRFIIIEPGGAVRSLPLGIAEHG